MSKNIRILLIMMAPIFLIGTYSCDNNEVFTPYENFGNYADLQDSFDSLNQMRLEINPIEELDAYLDNHSIHLEANSIANNANELILDPCEVEVKTMSDKGYLVFNDISSISNNQIIEIHQAIETNISSLTRPNESLDFVEDKPFSINVATIQNNSLSLMEPINDKHEWQLSDQSLMDSNEWEIDGINIEGYGLTFEKSGWLAIGNLIENIVFRDVEIDVELPEYFDAANTKVYAVFEDYNSVIKLDYYQEENVFKNEGIKKPFGADIKIISISSLGEDNYYYGSIDAMITKEVKENLTPEQHTLADIIELVKAL